MYTFLTSLSGFLKFSAAITDNWVFQLHYKFTVMLLLAFSILVTSFQFFGDPIDCITSGADIPQKIIDNYCWVHSTYTLPSAFDKTVGVDVPFAGIDKTVPGQKKIYHAYYQWVCFFLFFQAILFYVPRFVWRVAEGKTVQKLMLQLGKPFMGREANETSEQSKMDNDARVRNYAELLAGYLKRSQGGHGLYAHTFYLCEALNFANVVGAIYFANTFLGGEFTTYGTEVIKFTMEDEMNRTDPMIKIFPRITKCAFRRFGPSGDIQNHDAMCILPINMLNEKIFIFLWFYYIVLSVVSGLVVVYHLAVIALKPVRAYVLTRGMGSDSKEAAEACLMLKNLSREYNLSDWLLLKLLKQNINPINFNAVVDSLAKQEKEGSVRNRKRNDKGDDESKESFVESV